MCRIGQTVTDPKGRLTTKPSIVARTVVRGDSARAEVIEGLDEFAPGDVLLTHDGGRTVIVVHAKRRTYSVVRLDSLAPQLAAAFRKGSIKGRAENATIALDRLEAKDSIAGFSVNRARIVRSSTLVIKALIITKRLPTSETIDLWLSPAHRGLPNPLGGLFLALLEAPSKADPGLARRGEAISDTLSYAAPLRVVHRLVSGAAKDQVETVTTIELTDLAAPPPAAESVSFQIPAGLKLSDK